MRVISGKYKGKSLIGFNFDTTRPTMDRIKESVFGMIQNKVKNSIVLDLFAGSGSLGIEALSNGALKCYFVDNNIDLINTIEINTQNMNEDCNVIKSDYKEALNYFKNNSIKFDVVFLDPPYKLNLIGECLNMLYKYNLINTNGIIICEYENEILNNVYFKLVKMKKYGVKKISIYIFDN